MKGDCTPLMEAASAGHTDIVRYFCNLHFLYLQIQIARLLIAHGADVNAQSSSGNTPLMYACAGGHEEVPVNTNTNSDRTNTDAHKYVQVVRVLLEAGANVEDHNENGHTPLMEAASGISSI